MSAALTVCAALAGTVPAAHAQDTLSAASAGQTGIPPAGAPGAESPDSAGHGPFFTSTDAWLAAGFALGTVAMAPLDLALAGELQDSTLQAHETMRHLADGLRLLGFPGTVLLGGSMYAVGRLGDLPGVAEAGLRGTEAVVLSYAVVWTGKNLLGRSRPDRNPDDPFDFDFARGFAGGSDHRSFPSGHTASAFAFAAAVSEEIRHHWPRATPWAASALYSGALLVGISRMYHNRHWASDVVIGAGVGTFSGLKVVSYHHRNPGGVLDRWLLPAAVMPTRSGVQVIWRIAAP